MTKIKDISKLLERCVSNGLGGNRTDAEMGRLANEWLEVLGAFSAELLNKALTQYLANDSGSYVRMPKAGEIKLICENILEDEERQHSLEGENRCFLCYGKGRALVNAAALSVDYTEQPAKPEDLFHKHYSSLGVPCPCRWPEELQKLRRGQQVRRYRKKQLPSGQRIVTEYLEMWLERGRLYGRIRQVAPSSPAAVEPPAVRQQSLKQASNDDLTDDLPF